MIAYLKSIYSQPLNFGDALILAASYLLFRYLGEFIYPCLREWWRDWRNR